MIEYTVKVYDSGNKQWFLNGKLHREDGPAIERPDGYKAWFLNDVRYTEEEYYSKLNPAKVKVDDIGTKAWEPNGKMHKDEGPAISC